MSFRESTSSELLGVADIYTSLSDAPETFLIDDTEKKRAPRKPILK